MTIQELKDKGLILLECISGSKAYGLDTAASDTDIKGVFYLPKEQFYGIGYIEQVSNETNDEVYYELGRFVELLLKNNPNLLELLATPPDSILYKHPLMDRLTPELFLSKLCRDTFAGYALTQIQKARGLKKKIVNPVDKKRRSILDFCFIVQAHASVPLKVWLAGHRLYQERCGLTNIPHTKGLYALFYDEAQTLRYKGISSGDEANEVSLSSIPKGEKAMAYLFFNIESYSAYCKEYREYWEWVDKRNDNRYNSNRQHGRQYDAKNMMHTIRLLQVAEEIISTGQLQVRRPNRDELLAIKRGDYAYGDLLMMAGDLMQRVEAAGAGSPLPDKPDAEKGEALLVAMRTELYQ